jgi:hypothetical protein
MAIATWQDSKKIYNPVDNKVVQADFINTMIAELPIFETYYDPANVEVHGKEGTYFGGQMSENSPIKWSDDWLFNRWPKSEELEQKIPLIEYGLFGDRSSKDFAKLAYEAPDILAKHYESKITSVYGQWKRSVSEVILHDLCNQNAYADTAKNELDKDYFKIDTDSNKIKENQSKALNIIAKIEEVAYEMISYSRKFNKSGKEAVTASLKDLVLTMDPTVNTFLNTYGLAQVFNSGYLDLKQKIGKVIVAKLPTVVDGTPKPAVFWKEDPTTRVLTSTDYSTTDGQIGDWRILLHDKNFYKINDAINQPRDEGVFVETAFYKSQLKNLIGKWYFAVQGCISFVNAAYWTCKTTEKKGKEKTSG